MYTEGFDDQREADDKPSRTYVSGASPDPAKVLRENERLKKSLEKEQFFNRLLDQELKDLKSGNSRESDYGDSDLRKKGFNKSSYAIGLLALMLAGFIGYYVFNNFFGGSSTGIAATSEMLVQQPAPVVADSVAEVIAVKPSSPVSKLKQTPAVTEKSAAAVEVVKNKVVPAEKMEPVVPEASTPVEETTEATVSAPTAAPPVSVTPSSASSKSVIATYRVTSKANFYNAPDENTMKSYFISQSNDKTVDALEEKDDFIYVEFKNDVGYVTKGWLSKKDLTKE